MAKRAALRAQLPEGSVANIVFTLAHKENNKEKQPQQTSESPLFAQKSAKQERNAKKKTDRMLSMRAA